MIRVMQVQLDDGSSIKCRGPAELAIHAGDLCVVESAGVLEFGRIVRMKDASGDKPDVQGLPVVLRRATLQDQSRARENTVYLKMAADTCGRKVKQHKLAMQIANVRYSFDRKLVTISYIAEERVQFGDMVKEVGDELHARVEMKQIGVRDQARLVGGMGTCGRRLCCNLWLSNFEGVTVRMAKNQGLSLNPSTISGMCGRLKCCLRYENSCYLELQRKLPKDGARVKCPAGCGCVVDRNVLEQRVKVKLDEDGTREYPANEVVENKV